MPSSDYVVSVDHVANAKMETHTEFLARVSVLAARRLRNTYFKSLKSLEENPQRCSLYRFNSGDMNLRELLFAKRYRIVFEIIGRFVYVYDIQDCRQDADKNLI